MQQSIKLGAVLLASALAVGCGIKTEVEPAHVGKLLGKNGFAPETIPPSKFRLPMCWAYCDKLVVLETSDRPFKEELDLFMPKDKLKLTVDIRGTLSIPTNPPIVDSLFDKVPAEYVNERFGKITAGKVYNTYGQQALRGVVRSELAKYEISDILANREAISQQIHAAVTSKMKATSTPLLVTRFELARIDPPAVIVEAQEAAKEREIDIQKAEADAQVQLVEAERALAVAKTERLVQKEKALAIAEQNQIAADSVTPELLAYRRIEMMEKVYSELARSENVVIVPMDNSALTSVTDDVVLSKMLGKELKTAISNGG